MGCCARFNDLQHTSPVTLRVTTSTIEMMAWQTKTASAFRIKKNPVPLIAPKLTLSGADWWTDWVETLKSLHSLERFQDMDYLIPTLSKDFQGVIPRPGSSDRSLRWLKGALIRQGVGQELVQPLSWHSFRVFIPDCAYQLGIPGPNGNTWEIGRLSPQRTSTQERNGMWWWTCGARSSPECGISTWTRGKRYEKISPMKTGMTSLASLNRGALRRRGHFTLFRMSGYISASAAAVGAGSCKDGFPHTPQPEAEYGSGYGLDPAAAHGASGVSARFPHTQVPPRGRKKMKTNATQLETGGAPNNTDTPESVDGPLGTPQVSPFVSLLGANLIDSFPWLRYVPDRLRHRLTPALAPGDLAPGPVLILLYAGRDDPLSLDSCIHALPQAFSSHCGL